MADKKSDKKHKQQAMEGKSNADALISSRLKTYYDSIVDEGTPDHFLDLLEKLDAAERAAKEKNR